MKPVERDFATGTNEDAIDRRTGRWEKCGVCGGLGTLISGDHNTSPCPFCLCGSVFVRAAIEKEAK